VIETELKKILRAASGILAFSAAMDFGLWILWGYTAPSWIIATLSLCVAGLLEVLVRLQATPDYPLDELAAALGFCPGFNGCPQKGPRECAKCLGAISRDLRSPS